MDLRLHASDDPVDLHAGTADAAIRYGRGGFANLKSEELLRDEFAPVCSPSLGLRRREDLARETLIHSKWRWARRENPVWSRWLERVALAHLQPRRQLIHTDASQAIQAAIAGHGVALVSQLLVSEEIARETLLQPFGPVLEGYRYFVVYPRSIGALGAHRGASGLDSKRAQCSVTRPGLAAADDASVTDEGWKFVGSVAKAKR